jgi:hypothetical protein
MAKKANSHKKNRPGRKDKYISFSPSLISGICSVSILFITFIYYWKDIFPEQSPLQLIRFFVYGILAVCFMYAAFMYCAFPDATAKNKQLLISTITAVGVFYMIVVNTEWFFGGDSGMYIVLTKSLATFNGYVDLNELAYKPHTQYGFGLPMLLVPAYWIFGASITAFNITIALVSTAFIYCLFLLFRKQLHGYLALMFIIAVAVNYWVVQFSTVVMTEAPFYFAVTATFLAVARYAKEQKTFNHWFWLVTVLAIFTYQVKVIGIGLLAAIVIYFCIKRDYKKSGALAASLFLLFLFWNIRNYLVGSNVYISAMLNVIDAGTGDSLGAHDEGLGFFGNFFWKPVRSLIYGWKFLIPMVFSSRNESMWIPGQILVMILGYTGLAIHCFRKLTVYDIATIIIFFGIALYGGVLFPERWWMPLIPFTLYYIVFGWQEIEKFILSKLKSETIGPISRVIIVVFLGIIVAQGLQESNPIVVMSHAAEKSSANARAYIEAAYWVRNNTPHDVRIASRLDKEFYILSDRKGINARVWHEFEYTYTDAMRDEVLSNMKDLIIQYDIDYWILDMTRTDSQVSIMVLQQNPGVFNSMFQIAFAYPEQPDSRAFVLKVKKEWFKQNSNDK